MQNRTDSELLRLYARERSEPAFAEIVRRYAALVYSAALRQSGDSEQARDIAQTVFSDLARKAQTLRDDTLLAAWLHKSVRFQCLEQHRNDHRRLRRESHAMEIIQSSDPAKDWSAIQPVLDDAIAQLPEDDRNALLLRFFKNESLADVGAALGVSEDAAQKRVSRALLRLRDLLILRGVTTAADALSATIAGHAVETLPHGLIASLTTQAIATGATFPAPSAVAKIWTLVKANAAALTLAAGLAAMAILHFRAHERIQQLRADSRDLVAHLAALQAQNADLQSRLARLPRPPISDSNVLEIARLRAKVAQLRADLAAKTSALTTAAASQPAIVPVDSAPPQLQITALFLTLPSKGSHFRSEGSALSESQAALAISNEESAPDANLVAVPRAVTLCGRDVSLSITRNVGTGGGETNIGINFFASPICSSDSNSIDLIMVSQVSRLNARSNVEQFVWTNESTLLSGMTLRLRNRLPYSGPWFENDPSNWSRTRDIEVFVTPTLVDAAGNRLFPTNPGSAR